MTGLLQQMSDVISLREKVAQAELTARIYAPEGPILTDDKLLSRRSRNALDR
jgi:hypothetical protein